eukprot:UN11928
MYLSYGFTTRQYELCCKCCDIGIKKYCVWCTKKAIQRKSGKDVADNNIQVIQNESGYSNTNGKYGMEHDDTHQLAVPSKSSRTHQSTASDSTRNGTNDSEISATNMEMTIQNSEKITRTSVTETV